MSSTCSSSLAGGIADDLGSVYDATEPATALFLPDGRAASLMGVDYTDDEVVEALLAIGADVERSPTAVGPSCHRRGGATWSTTAGLVEEVARITGYDRIPSVLPVAPPGRGLSREQQLRRQVSASLAAAGLDEVFAYPFVSTVQNAAFGSSDGSVVPAVRLANPLDSAAPELRRSVLPGLLDVVRRNLARGLVDLAVYETGTVFLPEAGTTYGTETVPVGASRPDDELLRSLHASLPPQPRHVGVAFAGSAVDRQPGQAAVAVSLAEALDAVRVAVHAVAAEVSFRQGSHPSLHPGRTAEIVVAGEVVGVAGELLPSLAAELDLPRVVAVAEFDLDRVLELARVEPEPAPISSYPAATQDVSLVVGVDVAAGDVLEVVRQGAGALLESARLVDDYRGEGLGENTKSLTFALRFRATDRTLTQAEATEAKQGSVRLAAERFGAALRD